MNKMFDNLCILVCTTALIQCASGTPEASATRVNATENTQMPKQLKIVNRDPVAIEYNDPGPTINAFPSVINESINKIMNENLKPSNNHSNTDFVNIVNKYATCLNEFLGILEATNELMKSVRDKLNKISKNVNDSSEEDYNWF